MSVIKINLTEQLTDGQSITFKAPCDCTAITGLTVYYPGEDGTEYKNFTMKDAHGNDLTGIGNLFTTGAYVKVVVNTTDGLAYIQNSDTNGYIESTMLKAADCVDNLESTSTNLPLSANQGNVLNGKFGGCTFSTEADGAYVSYTDAGGETVKKKLGSGKDNLHILEGTTTNGTVTIPAGLADVCAQIKGVTNPNKYFDLNTSGGHNVGCGASATYNSETGVVTFKCWGSVSGGGGGTANATTFSYKIMYWLEE